MTTMSISCTDLNSRAQPCKSALAIDRKIEAVEAAGKERFYLTHFSYYDSNDGGTGDTHPKHIVYQKALPSITQVPDLDSMKSYEPG